MSKLFLLIALLAVAGGCDQIDDIVSEENDPLWRCCPAEASFSIPDGTFHTCKPELGNCPPTGVSGCTDGFCQVALDVVSCCCDGADGPIAATCDDSALAAGCVERSDPLQNCGDLL